ncbi:MAG: 16S rRNA (cytosine(967)-C(5))-methyltransferase RsmB [Candidatus Binatia bacterium]
MTATDPRRLAAEVLLDVEEGQWSDEALARALAGSGLGDADRALATRLVYGVLARQRTLDHSIEAWASRKVAKLDAVVRTALRLGLYQMAFLDRVPDHAAVATSVELVTRRARSAKGFVNALLRRAQREGLVPPPASPATKRLGVVHSHPDWLVEMWTAELGAEETELLMAANNEAAPTCYRALSDRDAAVRALVALRIDACAGSHASSSILVSGPVLDLEGLAVVQGEASQLVVEMLDPRPGEKVLDACAAPGGKTAAIAGRVGATGHVVACDPAPRSGERIRASLAMAGIRGGVTIHGCAVEELGSVLAGLKAGEGRSDTAQGGMDPAEGLFDAVLADAPCSGLGTLRQHPEIRWRRRPDDLEDLARRQGSVLRAAAALVKPGGRLVYSTCTIARIENEDVVAAFLAAHPEFTRETRDTLPPSVAALCDEDGTLRTFPHRHGIDGFFAVRLRRRGGENPA